MKIQYLTYDLTLYSVLHLTLNLGSRLHEIYPVPSRSRGIYISKFENARFKNLGGDVFTRKYII